MIRTIVLAGPDPTGRDTRTRPFTLPALPEPFEWVARALHEAPDVDGRPGEFRAIETETGNAQSMTAPFTSHHAEHETGWYMVQWYNTSQASIFTVPVRITGDFGHATAALPT